jgi:tetratricopeptide (TPR) repeat protein
MGSFGEIRHSYLRIFAVKTYVHLLIIAAIGFAAYSNTFRVPFEFDDFDHIANNLMIRSIDNFSLALKGHDFGSSAYLYSPSRSIGYFTFALNYYFGGLDVKGYHLVNLFIHIVNAFLVYFFVVLTLRMPYFSPFPRAAEEGRKQNAVHNLPAENHSPAAIHHSRLIALLSSLLFVAHPVQTQAVTYIVQRFASLATLFYLLSFVMYIKGRLAAIGKERGTDGMNIPMPKGKLNKVASPIASRLLPLVYYVLSLVCAFLAMRTKEIAYTLPLVIILYEATFITASLKKRLLFLLPVVLMLIIVTLGVINIDKPLGEILSQVEATTRAETKMPRWDYLMTEMRVIVTYIRLIFMPVNQCLDYDYPLYHSPAEPPVYLSLLFLSAVFGAAVYLMYKSRLNPSPARFPIRASRFEHYRLIAFGIFWFFITLSVESSIIPIKDVICEHRVYLPSVGAFIAISSGLYAVAARLTHGRGIALLFILIALGLSVATYTRNNIWKERVSLWEDVVIKSPNLARAHTGLGAVYYNQGRLDEAMKEFQTAVSINLSDFGAHYNIGLIYWRMDRLDDAKKEFQAALWLRPDNADMHNALGKVYEQEGFLHDAVREYQAALMLNPDHVGARRNLEGLNHKTQGDIDQ